MIKRKPQTLFTLLLAFICTFALILTAQAAGPGEGLPAGEEETSEVSRVILAGAHRGTTETTETEAAVEAEATTETAAQAAESTDLVAPATVPPTAQWIQGQSLGRFTTTGYCNCSKCSGGHNLTYSGTVPKANHTISADLDVFPIGTKVMINGIVYTVEDMGSGVNGRWLDVYYDNHSQAVAHGMKTEEVFAVTLP